MEITNGYQVAAIVVVGLLLVSLINNFFRHREIMAGKRDPQVEKKLEVEDSKNFFKKGGPHDVD